MTILVDVAGPVVLELALISIKNCSIVSTLASISFRLVTLDVNLTSCSAAVRVTAPPVGSSVDPAWVTISPKLASLIEIIVIVKEVILNIDETSAMTWD